MKIVTLYKGKPAAPKFLCPGGNPRNFGAVRLPNFFASVVLRRRPPATFTLQPSSSTAADHRPPRAAGLRARTGLVLHHAAGCRSSSTAARPLHRPCLCRRSTAPPPFHRSSAAAAVHHARARSHTSAPPPPAASPRPLHLAADLSTAAGCSTAAAAISLSLSQSSTSGFIIGLSSSTGEDVLGRTASSAGSSSTAEPRRRPFLRRPRPKLIVGRSSSTDMCACGCSFLYMCACGCEGVYMCVHVGVNGNEGWVICERGVICDCECEFGNVGDM
ncbi:hypothetical protein [Oryza sativa Japonica Group]|uniref:Uncharacterized protein n=2 Tax=Oryza sativa subsp. japonica TaxID=39947 RepID=Q657G3_ORYSJ|nr:hypothetical protein [Oryza sativa Japonica Group]BAD45689.1 hypothetical protein [Oryza sativa Japonica Group]